MATVNELLAAFRPQALHLTERQALVWTLRAQGASQAQIAASWGTSRANICMLERAARNHIARSRETLAFDAALRAPVQLVCRPGELLLDIQSRLQRCCGPQAQQPELEGLSVPDEMAAKAPDCVRDNRLIRPLLIWVTVDGELGLRPLRQVTD